MKKILLPLLLIVILGTVLRFYNLGQIPVGFHRDEAYFGYSAYSILKTGMDMTGNLLPLHLKSVLFSPTGYSYFSIPSILLFDLNEFSVRFAAAFFGVLTIVLTYFFTIILFEKNKYKEKVALLSAFLLAISPWNINLSRASTENVVVVFFIVLGIIFYKKWIDINKIYLLSLSFLCFFISLYIYQAPRSFLPFFLPLVFIYFSYQNKKKLLTSFLIYISVIIIPVLLIIFSNDLTLRFKMLSIFNSPATQLVLDERLREDGVMTITPIEARVFHNKISGYFSTFLLNYSDHFSYRFLFTDSGLPDRYKVPGAGLLYIFELPLLIIGLYILFNKDRKLFTFLTGWVIVAPIGSALTYDDIPNLQRTLIILPTFPILASVGLVFIWEKLNGVNFNKRLIFFSKSVLFIIIVFNILHYLHSYYIHQVTHRPWYRQEGYKNLINTLNVLDKVNIYKKIVVTQSQTDPAIFFIFYNKKDPKEVQELFKTVKNGNYGNLSFDKYIFSPDECPLREVLITDTKTLETVSYIKGQEGVLYVNSGTCKLPDKGIEVLSQIKRNDNTIVFIIAKIGKGAKIYNEK